MKLTSHRMFGWRTLCLRGLVVSIGLIATATLSAQESLPAGEVIEPAPATADPHERSPDDIANPSPVKQPTSKLAADEDPKVDLSNITGTWSRAEGGPFSKLTVWQVENQERMYFVECDAGTGLLNRNVQNGTMNGYFSFDLLGSRTAVAYLIPNEPTNSYQLHIEPFDDQRKQLLRKEFAKTERELKQKLSSNWTRVAAPAQPKLTVSVVKTEIEPSRVRDALRAKYREQPYRFFSNDTFQSVIAIAPEEAQEEIEVLVHKLDVKETSFDEVASPLNAQAVPANSRPVPHPVPYSDQPPEAYNFERLFEVRRSAEAAAKSIDQKTTGCIWAFPDSPAIGFTKVGDSVDLLLPDVERFVVLEAGQKYVTPMRVVAKGLPVEKLVDYGGDVRFTVRLTQIENNLLDRLPTDDVLREMTITHVVRLKHAAAEQVAALIHEAFPFGKRDSELEQQVPLVSCEADLKQNAVVLKGQMVSSWQPLALLEVEAAIQKLDLPAPGTATRVQRASALPDTPAAKQLVEQLGAQESAAAAEAATIRQLQANGQAEQNRQAIAEHQRKLKNLLSTAFDLKLQLEELQVQELQSRLSRLERQIGQRKELREKIINRRAGELIEGDTLKWTPDSATDAVNAARSKPMSRESAAETPRGAAIEDQRPVPLPNPREQDSGPVRSSQIHLVGPKGMEALLSTDGVFKPAASFAVPLRRNFERRHDEVTQHSIGFKNVPNHVATRFLGVLELYPDHAHTAEFLNHNAIPLVITNEDIERAISKKPGFVNPVTKIVYLPHPAVGQTANTSVETIVSTRLDPGVNPIDEAKRRGSILAVFSFYESGRPTTTGSEVERPHEADDIVVDLYAGSQVLPGLGRNPGYNKLVQTLHALKGVTVNFREAGKGDVIVMAIVRDPSQRCQREARQTQKESELRIAINSPLKAAGIEATRWDESAAAENAESTSADDAEAQNGSSKTDPFVKFLEVPAVINSEVIEATQNEAEARAKANERAAKLLWERLGLKSSGMVFRDQIPAEYRGGLMIDEVDAQRAAFAAGIRKGDILVGIHKWEMVSLDNVLFALNHPETQRAAPNGNAPLKAFVLRGKDRVLTPFVENGHSAEAPKVNATGFDD